MVVLSALLLALCPCARAANNARELSALFAKESFKREIVKPPLGLLRHEYIVPDGPYFQLFDWDMYFMGTALSYDKVSKPVMGSVEDFLDFVDEFAAWTGYAPREIAPDALWALPEMCKPFLAQAALRASLTSGNFTWLLGSDSPPSKSLDYLKLQHYERPDEGPRISFYQKLKDTLSFWENNRRAKDGLFVWYNGVESGADNNPAVSDEPSQITEGVDLQCYIYREYLALAFLAHKLGRAQDAALYRHKAQALRALIQKRMWSEKDGTFWNIDSRTGAFVKIKTWTNFVPLWAKVATPAQAKRMIKEHLLNPAEFWSPNGIRSLAKDEALYDARAGYWQGPVWILANYLMMHGLLNYGYDSQARQLARKTQRLLVADIKASGGMNENYDPETGAPDASGHFVSWNLLAQHMAQEAASGQDPTAIPAW
ncbi:MAG TPA: trehalase family glycosidase [Elusimicrobiota bacterium]|nr:trehalase family glycosidase [Elusimicrobiota bacterium]